MIIDTNFFESSEKIAIYLISLYYKTNCKYPCSRLHMNRLLAIYTLCIKKYKCDFLEKDFWISEENNGDIIPFVNIALTSFIPRDIYFRTDFNFNKEYINDELSETDAFNEEFKKDFPEFDEIEKSINPITKMLIEEIFRTFGNYSIHDLAILQKEIRQTIPTKRTYLFGIGRTIVDYEKYHEYLNLSTNNIILNFIKDFDPNNFISNEQTSTLKRNLVEYKNAQ